MTWVFGDYELDADVYELRQRGEILHLEPQAFDVLTHLVAHRDRVVSKAELLREVWRDRVVSESALTTRIKELRRALGDNGRAQQAIRTVHGRGYRFVGEVRAEAADSFAQEDHPRRNGTRPPMRTDQTLGRCQAPDGVRLGYAVLGDGPVIVQHPAPITHVVDDWASPAALDWIHLLANERRLVRFDLRGGGTSQHDVPPLSIDALVADIGAVADAVTSEPFTLLAHSIHGTLAVLYALERPDRVARLVLCGCPVMGPLAPGAPAAQRAEYETSIELFSQGWGNDRERFRRMVASALLPDAPAQVSEQFARLSHRLPVTSIGNFLRVSASVDLSEVVSQLQVPTMVVHAKGDTMVSFRHGEALARLIPGAQFVALPGSNHLLQASDPGWPLFSRELERFLQA